MRPALPFHACVHSPDTVLSVLQSPGWLIATLRGWCRCHPHLTGQNKDAKPHTAWKWQNHPSMELNVNRFQNLGSEDPWSEPGGPGAPSKLARRLWEGLAPRAPAQVGRERGLQGKWGGASTGLSAQPGALSRPLRVGPVPYSPHSRRRGASGSAGARLRRPPPWG